MTDSTQSPRLGSLDFVRIGLMLPVMVIVLASAGYLCKAGLADILYLNGARGDRVMWAWSLANSWPANVMSGALLAAMFVAALLWVAPPARRGAVAVGAAGAVVLWGALLVFGSANPWAAQPPSVGWPLAMGLATWFCGGWTLWLGRRASPAASLN